MNPRLLPYTQTQKPDKRAAIECIINFLKNKVYIKHVRDRSFILLIIKIAAAYHFFKKKPKVELDVNNIQNKMKKCIQDNNIHYPKLAL